VRSRHLLAVLVLCAAGCRGPRPAVLSSTLRSAAGGGSVLEVVVENSGGGEGSIEVEVTLRSDRNLVRADRQVTLRGHERVRVDLPFDVPADGSYRAEVTAKYPVD
jgi:hypothetical protein